MNASALHMLHRVGQCAEDLFQLEMSALDLTPRQFVILLVVSKDEGLSQTDLVERTGIDRSTLADVIRRMLRKGMLKRQRSKTDARAYAVELTEQGRAALETARPLVRRIEERLLAALPERRAEEFVLSLSAIVGGFGQAALRSLQTTDA